MCITCVCRRGQRKCQRLKSKRIPPVISSVAGSSRKKNFVTLLLLLETIGPSNPSNERMVPAPGERRDSQDSDGVHAGSRATGFPARLAHRHPRVPRVCQLHSRAPPLPCPDGAKAAVMTSRSAKSKHSPHFFHGQVLTPNCQHRPPNNPNGKLPFPRK